MKLKSYDFLEVSNNTNKAHGCNKVTRHPTATQAVIMIVYRSSSTPEPLSPVHKKRKQVINAKPTED